MNKKTQDSPVKTSRKAIQQQLIDELKKITSRFGSGSDKLIKEIEKGSKKLAKIISKELKADKPVNPEIINEVKGGNEVKNAIRSAPKEKSKVAAVATKPAATTGKAVTKVAETAPVQLKPVKKVSVKPEIKKDNKTS